MYNHNINHLMKTQYLELEMLKLLAYECINPRHNPTSLVLPLVCMTDLAARPGSLVCLFASVVRCKETDLCPKWT